MAAIILLVIGVYAFGFGVLGWAVGIAIALLIFNAVTEA